jgi:hypothetical protein
VLLGHTLAVQYTRCKTADVVHQPAAGHSINWKDSHSALLLLSVFLSVFLLGYALFLSGRKYTSEHGFNTQSAYRFLPSSAWLVLCALRRPSSPSALHHQHTCTQHSAIAVFTHRGRCRVLHDACGPYHRSDPGSCLCGLSRRSDPGPCLHPVPRFDL